MKAGEGDRRKLAYHDGLTELRQVKLTMFQVVCRYCVAVLIVAVGVALIITLLHSRFWYFLQQRAPP
jgi:hypothetical protein